MKCNHCGLEIPDDSKFCGACGKQTQAAGETVCPSCAAKATAGQQFCVKCGAKLVADAAGDLPGHPVASATAQQVAKQAVTESGVQPAGVLLRCLDGIIDTAVLFIIGFIIALFTGQTTKDGFDLQGFAALVWWLIGIGYYVIFEGKFGSTPGKMLLGLKVIKTDGSPCDTKAAIIRTAGRILDNFLLIGVLVIAFSKRKQRLGDKFAGTLVIKTKSIKLSQVKNNSFNNFDD